MRFIAQNPGLVVGIRSERRRLSMDGESIVTRPGISARFRALEFNQNDLDVALRSFQFRGMYQHVDEATPVEPLYRLAIYDTDEEYERRLDTEDEWSVEDKELVERRLLEAARVGDSFIVVPEETMEPPWPLYPLGEVDATDLVLTINNVIGIPFENVLAFEGSKWGPRREDVIEALQTAIRIRDEDKVIVGG
jgi:hypothetical protein